MRTARTIVAGAAAVAAAVVILAGLAGPAFADARDISVGGVYITTITHDSAGYTSYQRAEAVNRRITNVLSTPAFRSGATLTVQPQGPNAIINVGSMLVFTVTQEDVAGTNMTAVAVARQWAVKLAEGLSKAMPTGQFHVF